MLLYFSSFVTKFSHWNVLPLCSCSSYCNVLIFCVKLKLLSISGHLQSIWMIGGGDDGAAIYLSDVSLSVRGWVSLAQTWGSTGFREPTRGRDLWAGPLVLSFHSVESLAFIFLQGKHDGVFLVDLFCFIFTSDSCAYIGQILKLPHVIQGKMYCFLLSWDWSSYQKFTLGWGCLKFGQLL